MKLAQALKAYGITAWSPRSCGICDSPLQYYFTDDHAFFDASCDCSSYHTGLHPIAWYTFEDFIAQSEDPPKLLMNIIEPSGHRWAIVGHNDDPARFMTAQTGNPYPFTIDNLVTFDNPEDATFVALRFPGLRTITP